MSIFLGFNALKCCIKVINDAFLISPESVTTPSLTSAFTVGKSFVTSATFLTKAGSSAIITGADAALIAKLFITDLAPFSALAIDYLHQHASLEPFYKHSPNLEGIGRAIEERKTFHTKRKIVVAALKAQYQGMDVCEKVTLNIEKLADTNTFTICTAHQPNLFTGYLYFIYKIV
ncbi:MAG: bacillithiol biosynthesis BshC, partial [Sphingobacteriales bacterium]